MTENPLSNTEQHSSPESMFEDAEIEYMDSLPEYLIKAIDETKEDIENKEGFKLNTSYRFNFGTLGKQESFRHVVRAVGGKNEEWFEEGTLVTDNILNAGTYKDIFFHYEFEKVNTSDAQIWPEMESSDILSVKISFWNEKASISFDIGNLVHVLPKAWEEWSEGFSYGDISQFGLFEEKLLEVIESRDYLEGAEGLSEKHSINDYPDYLIYPDKKVEFGNTSWKEVDYDYLDRLRRTSELDTLLAEIERREAYEGYERPEWIPEGVRSRRNIHGISATDSFYPNDDIFDHELRRFFGPRENG